VSFSKVLGLDTGSVAFDPVISAADASMSLVGRATEVVERNRGTRHHVVPLCTLAPDVVAWVGYREAWVKPISERNFRYVDGGFTLHVGRAGYLEKPQILRSEWSGSRSKSFLNLAGHPHWQLDALESARINRAERLSFGKPMPITKQFEATPETDATQRMLLGLTIERLHLASAAAWWREPVALVANSPATVADIDRWMLGCVAYLKQEAARCAILVY
jgi:hypothetical protein